MLEHEQALREQLLAGLAGDAVAYRAFLGAMAGYMRMFYRRRLTNLPDDVEDLVQECLLAVHNQRHTYDASQPVTAWVYAIARYKLVDLWRRRQRTDALHVPLAAEQELFAQSTLDEDDARRDVVTLLATLPDRQRLPIVHVKLEGRSVAETAALTGMSVSAVKIGIHRGLKALAARMRSEP